MKATIRDSVAKNNITNKNPDTFLDKELEENLKIFNDFKSYNNFLKKKGIIINQEKRKELLLFNYTIPSIQSHE